MLAAVVEAPGRLALSRCEMPKPQAGQVLIKVEGSGVCASEMNIWQGRPWFQYPLPPGRPGHESWGTVQQLGDGVCTFRVGDRVCSFGQYVYAQYATAGVLEIVRLPDELAGKPFPGEPVACAMNSFRRCGIHKGDRVAIVGGGFQGLLLTQLAAREDAAVTVLSRRPFALEMARAMGARHTIHLADPGRAMEQALDLTKGEGYDRVIEATGYQAPLDLATELTRTAGRLIIVGYHQDPRYVNMQQWNWRGIDVINAHERDQRKNVEALWDAIEAVVEGDLNISPLLTHTYSLDALDQALNMTLEHPDGFVKAIVVP